MTFNTPEDLARQINPVRFDVWWLVLWLALCGGAACMA